MPKLLSVLAVTGFMAVAGAYAYAAPEARLLEFIEEQRPQPRATGSLSLLVESRPPSLPSLVVARTVSTDEQIGAARKSRPFALSTECRAAEHNVAGQVNQL